MEFLHFKDDIYFIKFKALIMKKFISVLIASILISHTIFAQSSGDYRSIGNGNWNEKANTINDKQYFVENKGQWPGEVLFMTRIAGVDVWITDHGVVYDFNKMRQKTGKKTKKKMTPAQFKDNREPIENSERFGQVVKMTLQDKVPGSTALGKEKSTGYYNYFLGNDPSKWAEHVDLYKEVLVKNIYKGIDVRYYFDRGSIRYDYVVQPGAEVKNIKMNFEGTDKIYLNGPDELVMLTRF